MTKPATFDIDEAAFQAVLVEATGDRKAPTIDSFFEALGTFMSRSQAPASVEVTQ